MGGPVDATTGMVCDLGELDANGNLKFRGRKKNVIVTSAGLNIHPEDLEAALKKQPAIRDAVVVPLNRNNNPEPCAVLLATDQNIVIPSTPPSVFVGSESRNLSSVSDFTVERCSLTLTGPGAVSSLCCKSFMFLILGTSKFVLTRTVLMC